MAQEIQIVVSRKIGSCACEISLQQIIGAKGFRKSDVKKGPAEFIPVAGS